MNEHPVMAGRHTPPARFQPGSPLALEFAVDRAYASVRLHYRRVNQAERWQVTPMQPAHRFWHAAIPAAYTESPYALQYYLEVIQAPGSAALYPGFGEHLTDQPYFVVRRG